MKSLNPKEMSNENTILKPESKNYPSCYIDFLKYESLSGGDKVLDELSYDCIAKRNDGHFYYVKFSGTKISYKRLYEGKLNAIN